MKTGTLYVVATPIGHLDDITYRAVDVLLGVDCIMAEDTRHSQRLLNHYHIQKPLESLHTHNESSKSLTVIQKLLEGQSIALICDAGTPLVNDPGYELVKRAHELDITVCPIPGACAAITALSGSGLTGSRFVFEGFLPARQTARQRVLTSLKQEVRTLLFYEVPHRIRDSLADMAKVFGSDRKAVMARELTKKFETLRCLPLGELVDWVNNNPNQQRGEFVIVVEGLSVKSKKEVDCQGFGLDMRRGVFDLNQNKFDESIFEEDQIVLEVRRILGLLMAELSKRQAIVLTAAITGMAKNRVYQLAHDT